MPFATCNEFGQSLKGNPKIKLDGKWFPVGRNNIDGIVPGSQVEVEFGSFPDSKTGQPVACINKIRPAPMNGHGMQGNYAPQPKPDSAPFKMPPSPTGMVCEVSPLDDSGMRFISNLVGSAVTGGHVTAPAELSVWTVAAYRAFKAIKSTVAEPEFNDRIPGEDDGDSENPAPPSRW